MATERLKTIKSSGGDYTSLNAAEAGEDDLGDLVSRDEYVVFECYATEDISPVLIDGWNTDSNRYIKVYTPTSERHDGKWNTSKYRLTPTNWDYTLIVQEAYTEIDGLQVQSSLNNDNVLGGISITAGIVTISRCIIKHSGSTGNNKVGIQILWSVDNPHKIFNNLIYDFSGAGHIGINHDGNAGAPPSVFYNNTIVNCTVGINSSDNLNQGKAVNNLFRSCGTAMIGTFASGSGYNATDLASLNYTVTGGATGDRVSQTFTFVDADNNDYHLQSGDAGAKDLGVSDPGSGLFSDDIDGETRSGSWDIGADEYVAAGGSSVVPIIMQQLNQFDGGSIL